MLLRKSYITLVLGLLGGFSIYIAVLGAILGLSLAAYLVAYLIILFFLPAIVKRKYIFRFSWCRTFLWLFLFFALYSIKYSVSHVASHEKLLNILYSIVSPLLIWELIIGWIPDIKTKILSVEKNIINISKWLLVLSFLLFILGFTVNYNPGRYGLVGMINPIWAGRIFACLTLWIGYEYIYLKKRSVNSVFFVFLGGCLVYKTGSNGPLLAFSLCCLILMKDKLNARRVIYIILILSIFVIAFLLGERGADAAMFSFLARMDLIDFVLAFHPQNIWLGAGIGSFGVLYLNVDKIIYPHNIFLEVYFEWGIIGLVLFVSVLILLLSKMQLNYVTIAFLFYLINSLFSGDIVGNNFFFFFLYLSSFVAVDKERCRRN